MDFLLNESRQIYISRINKVQDYIETHLADELRVEELAKIAAFSEFHFQRIYRQIAGESLYSYIKRLRLEKAVFLIRSNKRLSIQDIALAVGFSNQASFAKALKERYSASARQIRNLPDLDMDKLNRNISMNGKVWLEKKHYNSPSELTIRSIEPTKVLYLRHTGSYKGDHDLFMKLFTKLYTYAARKNLLKAETKWFTIYHDFGKLTREERLRLSVCLSLTEEIEAAGEFGTRDLAGGQYAVGKFLLKSDEYQGAWDYLLTKWLPESGYMPDDRLCFEYYPPQERTVTTDPEGRIVEIFIPITPL